MGILLLIVGMGCAIVGGIWLLVEAFRESLLWGLGSLLFPIISLIFVILHWSVCWRPFALNVVGVLLLLAGMALMTPTPGVH
jgi:uncharacterized membrane protein